MYQIVSIPFVSKCDETKSWPVENPLTLPEVRGGRAESVRHEVDVFVHFDEVVLWWGRHRPDGRIDWREDASDGRNICAPGSKVLYEDADENVSK